MTRKIYLNIQQVAEIEVVQGTDGSDVQHLRTWKDRASRNIWEKVRLFQHIIWRSYCNVNERFILATNGFCSNRPSVPFDWKPILPYAKESFIHLHYFLINEFVT